MSRGEDISTKSNANLWYAQHDLALSTARSAAAHWGPGAPHTFVLIAKSTRPRHCNCYQPCAVLNMYTKLDRKKNGVNSFSLVYLASQAM
jgi:hypothetical protein